MKTLILLTVLISASFADFSFNKDEALNLFRSESSFSQRMRLDDSHFFNSNKPYKGYWCSNSVLSTLADSNGASVNRSVLSIFVDSAANFYENQRGQLSKSSTTASSISSSEMSKNWKQIIYSIHWFKCSMNEEDDQLLALALFYRIPIGDWRLESIRRMSETQKMEVRAFHFLNQVERRNFDLSPDFLIDWLTPNQNEKTGYEKYEGEKIKSVDKIFKNLIEGNHREALRLLRENKFLKVARRYIKNGGNL